MYRGSSEANVGVRPRPGGMSMTEVGGLWLDGWMVDGRWMVFLHQLSICSIARMHLKQCFIIFMVTPQLTEVRNHHDTVVRHIQRLLIVFLLCVKV